MASDLGGYKKEHSMKILDVQELSFSVQQLLKF